MRRRAQSLSGTGDDERLPVGTAKDELSALADTLNEFLDRVHDGTLRERRMVSDAAHELRTPLAALRTQLELAHDDFGNASALELEIVGAENSVARLTALANGLLEFSRLEGESQDSSRTGSAELLDEAMGSIDRARMLALAKHVEVSFVVDDLDSGRRYALDPSGFARLLDNLLTNAVNAVDTRGTVELTLRQGGSDLEIDVRDDGPGVPETFCRGRLIDSPDRMNRAPRSRAAPGSALRWCGDRGKRRGDGPPVATLAAEPSLPSTFRRCKELHTDRPVPRHSTYPVRECKT